MLEKIIEILEKRTGLSKEELNRRIEEKKKEFSDLLSKEGAAFLVAKDLGIELKEETFLEIKDLVAGMKGVNLIGRIFKISDVFEFERRDKSKGKVVNVYIADPTGFVKLALWDENVDLVRKEIKVGDVVKIRNCFTRENIFSDIEISLGKYGKIEKAEKDYGLPSAEELEKRFLSLPERKEIKDLKEGIYEVKGNIVQIFKGKYLFNICPICKSSIKFNGKFECSDHGEVNPEKALVISGILDDGTSTIRFVLFREEAEKIIGLKTGELIELSDEERENVIKEKLLGMEVVFVGKVRMNKIFNKLEIIVSKVKDLDLKEESRKLLEKINLFTA